MRKLIIAALVAFTVPAHAGTHGYLMHIVFDGVETGVAGDPMKGKPSDEKPFTDKASCQAWLSMAIMMAASQNPERAKAMRLECKPA